MKGLAHRLGPRRSIVVIWCSLGMAIGLLALSPVALGNKSQFFFPGLLLGSLLLLVMIVDYSVSRSNESFKRGWYFTVIFSTALLGSAWVANLFVRLATSRRKIRLSVAAENCPGCGKLQGRTGFDLTFVRPSIDSFL